MERIKNQLRDSDRGVSPVIGVILMVAITVILAAVIGTFVLGLGENVQTSPQAGVSFSQSSGPTVTVTWVSEGNIEPGSTDLTVTGCLDSDKDLGSIGDTVDVDTCASGETITVTGTTPGGSSGVVAQYTLN